MIYISEAHARDEWPLSEKFSIHQQTLVEQRINAAKWLKAEFNCEFKILIDSIETHNSFESKYSSWPERGYIFNKGKLEYVSYAEVNGRMLWFNEIKSWLDSNNIQKQQE
jgi:hypothetical protein